MMRSGGLFAGYGGLDLAISQVFGTVPAWFSEIDDAPSRILAHHWPDVPNLGDITKIDWDRVLEMYGVLKVLGGGFPCQDVSAAGKRAGLKPGTRSGLWTHFAYGISKLRPQYVVIENVRGLLSAEAHSDMEPCPWCLGDEPSEPALRALGAVLADLAGLGYDARWCGLRAADVGAPHGRFRIFVLAADTAHDDRGRRADAGTTRRRPGIVARDTSSLGSGPSRPGDGEPRRSDRPRGTGQLATADTPGHGRHEGWPEPARQFGRPDVAVGSAASADWVPATDVPGHLRAPADADRDGRPQFWRIEPDARDPHGRDGADTAWGPYEPAVRRWERALGRLAPAPTELNAKGNQRLSPAFVEWMMGLPPGHVTGVPGINRNAQLKALGNGVVPQQAIAALTHMLNQMREAA